MHRLLSPLRHLGAQGAAANARAELESADRIAHQAATVARRVNRSDVGIPLNPAVAARVA